MSRIMTHVKWIAAVAALAGDGLIGSAMAAVTTADNHQATPEFVGHRYDLTYDNGFHVIDTFVSDHQIDFAVLSAPTPGRTGSVQYQWEEVAPHIYVISWDEADGGSVIHVDDFARHLSRSYYTPPGQSLLRSHAPIFAENISKTGTLKQVP